MSTDVEFVQFIVDQLDDYTAVTYKKMFGEYGLYSHGTLFGLACDDRLFIKPTAGGRSFIGDPVEAPAYPGARPSFLIEDQLENGEWLSELVRITTAELSA